MSYLELMVSVDGSSTGQALWGEGCICEHSGGQLLWLAPALIHSGTPSLICSRLRWLPPSSSMPGPVEGHTGSAVTDGAEGLEWGWLVDHFIQRHQGSLHRGDVI